MLPSCGAGRKLRFLLAHASIVDEPFEEPEQPELTIETEGQDVSAAVAAVRGLVE